MGNSICHIEIPCKDITRAKAFYGNIFDWVFEDHGETYAMFKAGEGVEGALDQRTENIPIGQGITLYIKVDDIPKYLKKIEEAGCSVVKEKTEISKEFGYYALFTDSEGNILGLWSQS
ncbi:VOC family protein [candidate division WOR-3 bacterium]|nr:VOC family protein [candidate division WOR-3 bacterium]MCK4576106.1 VOC family protein [candidate division WOR-3 bacterium]